MRRLVLPIALASLMMAGSVASAQSIRAGQAVSGAVGFGDTHHWGDGSTFNCYRLEGKAGDKVSINVESTDFEASLAPVGGDCRVVDGVFEARNGVISQTVTLHRGANYIRIFSPAGASGTYSLVAENTDDSGRLEGDALMDALLGPGSPSASYGDQRFIQLLQTRARLSVGQTSDWRVNLEHQGNYRVLGACDRACTNLNLEIRDPYGRTVDYHLADDADPVVMFRGQGSYTVAVTMVACEAASCLAGAAVFAE